MQACRLAGLHCCAKSDESGQGASVAWRGLGWRGWIACFGGQWAEEKASSSRPLRRVQGGMWVVLPQGMAGHCYVDLVRGRGRVHGMLPLRLGLLCCKVCSV